MDKNKTFSEAKQLYMEQYGDAIVTNNYLKVALFVVSVIALSLIYFNFRTQRLIENFKPLIVRIDDIGRAEAVSYKTFEYKPQAAEVKYFLSEFCRLYYGRNRFLLKGNFAQALYFMDSQLAGNVVEAYKKNKTIENFLTNQQDGDIDVEVKQVSIEDLRSAPYKARVEFEMVYYSPTDRSVTKRLFYTANFVFYFRDTVPNELIPINPLGLAITYFREDQAFVEPSHEQGRQP